MGRISHSKIYKMDQTKSASKSGYSRHRIEQLAQPKQSKQEYLTSFNERQLCWGDKDGMWTITKGALTANPSDRIKELSRPKKDWKDHNEEVFLYTYSCGRVSPLREPKKFSKENEESYKNSYIVKKSTQLAKPKYEPGFTSKGKLWTYSCGRESPIWKMKKNVTNRPNSSDKRLALPKISHRNFQPNRELRQDGRLSESFMAKLKAKGDAVCTERIQALAECKTSKEKDARWSRKKYIEFGRPEQAIRPVIKECLEYQATDIIEKLAQPNESRFAKYVPDRFNWPVSKAALRIF